MRFVVSTVSLTVVVLTVAISKISTTEWLWEVLSGDFTEVLGALSSEAVCGFTSLTNLGGLVVGDCLFGIVFTAYSNVLSRDFVWRAFGGTGFGFLAVSIPVKGVVFLLELVIGSSGRLGLSLWSGADWSVTLTIVLDARAVQLVCFWCLAFISACWLTCDLDGGCDS